ncbi:MAG: sigma-70 family RNA polymerase sigma factor [Pseudomonadota bacterium]
MTKGRQEDIEALIAEVAMGNKEAFSRLYDATSGKLLSVCLRVLDERAAAEDAMQEVFFKVWKNASRFKVTGHSPMTWLITIARNTAIDRLRGRKVHADVSEFSDRIAAPERTPEQSALVAAEARRMSTCLGELAMERRDAVKGAYLDGRSYQDLAKQFNVPLNTMRTWLRRSLLSLRECMSQ